MSLCHASLSWQDKATKQRSRQHGPAERSVWKRRHWPNTLARRVGPRPELYCGRSRDAGSTIGPSRSCLNKCGDYGYLYSNATHHCDTFKVRLQSSLAEPRLRRPAGPITLQILAQCLRVAARRQWHRTGFTTDVLGSAYGVRTITASRLVIA